MKPGTHIWAVLGALALVAGGWSANVIAQRGVSGLEAGVEDPDKARATLARATKAAREAEQRAEQFSREAEVASVALERTLSERAALAARIQAAEAQIAATDARLAILSEQRRTLNARLAQRQRPLVKLTGALQNMARRPLALSALRPGSLKDTVYLRAVLNSAVPQVRVRTADLRKDIAKGQEIERATNAQLAKLQGDERLLAERRTALSAILKRQQTTSQQASSIAMRENERALALAEEARDLDGLVDKLGEASVLRKELAGLSGPVLRPASPTQSQTASPSPSATPDRGEGLAQIALQLPVEGRTITGFGEKSEAGVTSTGIVIAPSAGAQVVAPASGRVAFSGPYSGFGRIIIIEHSDGWTSLITGLARSDVEAGAQLSRGSPLGVAADEKPAVSLELRRDSKPVNPLEYLD